MANIAYELALRFGTATYRLSQARRRDVGPTEHDMAAERLRPLPGLNLPPDRPVYWLHAVSLGEVGVAGVLAQELKRQAPGALAVVSTATATGLEAARKIAAVDAEVTARVDRRELMSSMFEGIRPVAVILVEGDLWRNLLALARRRGVPVFVANAKLSERSLRLYRRFPVYSHSLLSRITRVYAQTNLYLERFVEAGLPAGHGEVAGNVKLDTAAPAPSHEELAAVADAAGCAGADTVVTFGSLHPGEEVTALRGMQRVWESRPGAHCLIAPRHVEKTPQFLDRIRREFGLECRLYSRPESPGGHAPNRVTIVDRMGLLMTLYALADVGVVGGTFVDGIGGHNLTEPAFYGKPVIYGPHVYKQSGLHDLITAYDAGRQATPETFPEVLAALIADPDLARRLGANGRRMVADSRGAAARVVADIRRRVHDGPPKEDHP